MKRRSLSKKQSYEVPKENMVAVETNAKEPKTHFWWSFVALAICMIMGLSLARGLYAAGTADNGMEYDAYMGPVMPLHLMERPDGLTAVRSVTYDFASYSDSAPEIYRIHTDVTDAYMLTNHTDVDMTVTAVYPFKAKLQDMDWLVPTINADGEILETTLTVGGDLRNGALMDSGEKLIGVLDDGTYMEEAFDKALTLDMPCVVYSIGNLKYDGEVGGEITLEFGFHMDPEQNRVLMYNVRSFGYREKSGKFSVQMDVMHDLYNGPMHIILLDQDIGEYTLQGYSTAHCKEGTEVDGFTAEVTRTETTLGEWMASEIDWANWKKIYNDGQRLCIAYGLTDAQMQHYAADQMVEEEYINPIANGQIVMLDDLISTTLYADRMLYLTFPVTVPAGETVNVTAELVKYASSSHYGKNRDSHGYDLMTELGSELTFAEQTASVVNTEHVEFLDGNFGFDIENGVTEVILEPAVQHYWMRVAKK